MAISLTNIGAGNQSATSGGSNFGIGTPVVPVGSVIIVIASDTTSISDSKGNSYVSGVNVGSGALQIFYVLNSIALASGNTITCNLSGAPHGVGAGTAAYATGVSLFDSSITASSSGGSGQPSALTSGSPSGAGELFIGAANGFRNSSGNSFNNDTTNGWSSVFSQQGFTTNMGNQLTLLGGGYQVNAGTGTLTWQPSFSNSLVDWESAIIGFSSPTIWQGTSVYSGTGSLSALCKLVLQGAQTFGATGAMISTATLNELTTGEFDGAGSLSYQGNLGLIASANFSETVPPIPTLSALAVISGMVSSEFDGAGNLSCDSGTAPPGGFVALLNGTGSLSASVQQFSAAILRFNGTGGLTAVPALHIAVSAMFNGMSHMSLPNFAIIDFLASGSLSVDTIYRPRMGFFTGFGSLSANSFRIIHVNHRFAGAGRMDAQAIVRKGRGGVTANTVQSGPGTSFNITVAGG